MSDLWGSRERGEGRIDVDQNPVGSIDIVFRDVFANLVEIARASGWKA
jgi:hypothetical protein